VGQELLVLYGRGYWKAMRRLDPHLSSIVLVGPTSEPNQSPTAAAGRGSGWELEGERELAAQDATLFALLHDSVPDDGVDLAEPRIINPQAIPLHNSRPGKVQSPESPLDPEELEAPSQAQWLQYLSVDQLIDMVREAAAGDQH
jgi:hypothetical protein